MPLENPEEDKFDAVIPWVIGVGAVAATFLITGAVIWHFWVGSDIPHISISNSQTAAYWGQIGDFIGGMLNPLLSFVALMAVLYSVRMQRKELRLAREEAQENFQVQVQQRQNFERQNFEAVFFRLLDIHTRLANEVKISGSTDFRNSSARNLHIGRDAFKYAFRTLFGTRANKASEYIVHVKERVKYFDDHYSDNLAHYFRNFYQILKHVDSFGIDPLKLSRRYSFAAVRQFVSQYRAQRNYANMLRAQLDSAELGVLFFNCLTIKGAGLKYYVERYSMLKHFDKKIFFYSPDVVLQFYDPLAFADGEDIEPKQLRAHIRASRIEL